MTQIGNGPGYDINVMSKSLYLSVCSYLFQVMFSDLEINLQLGPISCKMLSQFSVYK